MACTPSQSVGVRPLFSRLPQVTVELLPDTELAAQVERREKDRLSSAKSSMTPEQIETVIRETEELKLRQVIGDLTFPLVCRSAA